MNKRQALQRIVHVAAGTAALALLPACKKSPYVFNAIDVTGADYAKAFTLTDHNGQLRNLSDFAGKVTVVFFGYTQCPDFCPTTMAEWAQVKKLLGADGARLQVLFITVDPERDTSAVLKAYMENFDPSFLALRATESQLEALAKDFHVFYKKVSSAAAGRYSVDHTSGSYVYDTQGHLRLFTRYGTAPDVLTKDIAQLLL